VLKNALVAFFNLAKLREKPLAKAQNNDPASLFWHRIHALVAAY
jgi:hypothetical protein